MILAPGAFKLPAVLLDVAGLGVIPIAFLAVQP